MSVKIIKGYLTNFSKEENFTRSLAYDNAMEALARRGHIVSSVVSRRNKLRTSEDTLEPQEKALYYIPESVNKQVGADDKTYIPPTNEEGTSLAPLGVGLGALVGAAALGYGAYKLAKKKAELKSNGYYAFDQTITKGACRNINSPARTRAQLRKQYPNSRIIKGSTAYQLNPQEFKAVG